MTTEPTPRPSSQIPLSALDAISLGTRFANLVPRDIASRALKGICDEGRGVGSVVNNQRLGVYLDFSSVIQKMGAEKVKEKYGNLFDMYESITGENPYEVPMKIYPAG